MCPWAEGDKVFSKNPDSAKGQPYATYYCQYLIGYYLSSSNLSDVYGAAGSLVLLLAWVYYSVLILLFGAHFTFVHSKVKGRIIKPDKSAVAIKIEEVEREATSVTED